ncbi:vitelline membrane outer layer protein 1 [Turdus rufiventris]|nr:vitelline membrane outer layer protein 1 [Turdus rufiventris]
MANTTQPWPPTPNHGQHNPTMATMKNPRPIPPSPLRSFGDWTRPKLCPPGEFIVSFRLRVEAAQGWWDDSAATDMAAMCSGGSRLEGGGLPHGDWGQWSKRCGSHCGVCGIRTRVEAAESGDNSGLNDLKLYCCS